MKSKTYSSLYVGVTENIPRRLDQHNCGNVRSTAKKRPYGLVWYCAFPNKIKALQFEKYLKHGSGFAFARKRLV